jgi:hypothetical protein
MCIWAAELPAPFVYSTGSLPVVCVYLGLRENNIGNGGKHKKKELKWKTNTKLWSFDLQRETYVKVVTRPAHH